MSSVLCISVLCPRLRLFSKFIDDNHELLFSSCSNMWPMRIPGQVYNLIWNLDIGVLIIIADSRLVSKPALTENVGVGPTNFQFFLDFTFRIWSKKKVRYVTFDCFKKRGSLTDTEEASRDNFSRELRFKIGLPISRHNFTQSPSHCLMLTKTKIIKKIAGLAHVVFIRSLLFPLFLPLQILWCLILWSHVNRK